MALYLIRTVDVMAEIIYFLILLRCILSWLPINRNNGFISIIYTLTEPVLAPIRNLFAKSPLGGAGMGIDFSPVVAFILIGIVSSIIKTIIISVF